MNSSKAPIEDIPENIYLALFKVKPNYAINSDQIVNKSDPNFDYIIKKKENLNLADDKSILIEALQLINSKKQKCLNLKSTSTNTGPYAYLPGIYLTFVP